MSSENYRAGTGKYEISCPVCGKKIIKNNGGGWPENSCEHLLYIWEEDRFCCSDAFRRMAAELYGEELIGDFNDNEAPWKENIDSIIATAENVLEQSGIKMEACFGDDCAGLLQFGAVREDISEKKSFLPADENLKAFVMLKRADMYFYSHRPECYLPGHVEDCFQLADLMSTCGTDDYISRWEKYQQGLKKYTDKWGDFAAFDEFREEKTNICDELLRRCDLATREVNCIMAAGEELAEADRTAWLQVLCAVTDLLGEEGKKEIIRKLEEQIKE